MPKQYVTSQGDMWDSIAYKQLGDERYMHLLIEANRQYREVVIFPANVTLVIPDVVVKPFASLPPWKRGGR